MTTYPPSDATVQLWRVLSTLVTFFVNGGNYCHNWEEMLSIPTVMKQLNYLSPLPFPILNPMPTRLSSVSRPHSSSSLNM